MTIRYANKVTYKKVFIVARRDSQVLVQYLNSCRRFWIPDEKFERMFKKLDT